MNRIFFSKRTAQHFSRVCTTAMPAYKQHVCAFLSYRCCVTFAVRIFPSSYSAAAIFRSYLVYTSLDTQRQNGGTDSGTTTTSGIFAHSIPYGRSQYVRAMKSSSLSESLSWVNTHASVYAASASTCNRPSSSLKWSLSSSSSLRRLPNHFVLWIVRAARRGKWRSNACPGIFDVTAAAGFFDLVLIITVFFFALDALTCLMLQWARFTIF